MSSLLFANDAKSTLAGSISNVSLSCNLATGTGALFPSPTGSDYFVMTFIDAATGLLKEIVHVTARSGDACTIVRAQEGTTGLNWSAGDFAVALVTAGTMASIQAQAAAAANALPLTGGALTGPVTSSSTITSSGGFAGNISGNVAGNVSGNVTGQLFGNATTATTAASATSAAVAAACSGNSATATLAAVAAACSGNSATASACTGNSATASSAASLAGLFTSALPGRVVIPIAGVNFIAQWGQNVTAGSGLVSVGFPVAFPNACLGVVCSEFSASGWGISNPFTYGIDGYNFNGFNAVGVRWNGTAWVGAIGSFQWIAWGY